MRRDDIIGLGKRGVSSIADTTSKYLTTENTVKGIKAVKSKRAELDKKHSLLGSTIFVVLFFMVAVVATIGLKEEVNPFGLGFGVNGLEVIVFSLVFSASIWVVGKIGDRHQ